MKVLILGATGYIGSAVADAAKARGHHVVGLARSDDAAKKLSAKGHEVARGDMRDPSSVAALARGVDAVVHTANTNDAENSRADPALVKAVLGALEGTGKRFVYTSGVWSAGRTGDRFVTEEDGGEPLPLVAWRGAVEQEVLASAGRGVRGVVVSPAIAYGRGGGIPGSFVAEARQKGHVRVVEGGAQEWTTVHVDDLADLYARALDAAPGSHFYAAAPGSVRVRDVAIAASLAGGAGGKVVDWPLAEARKEYGGYGEALALHQRVSGRKVERALGWAPRGPSLLEELLVGSYAKAR